MKSKFLKNLLFVLKNTNATVVEAIGDVNYFEGRERNEHKLKKGIVKINKDSNFKVEAINNHELKINNTFASKEEAQQWISSYEEAHKFLSENNDTSESLIKFNVVLNSQVNDEDFYKELVMQDEVTELQSYGEIKLVKFYDGKFAVVENCSIENRLFDNYINALESYNFEAECLYEYHKYEEQYNL